MRLDRLLEFLAALDLVHEPGEVGGLDAHHLVDRPSPELPEGEPGHEGFKWLGLGFLLSGHGNRLLSA